MGLADIIGLLFRWNHHIGDGAGDSQYNWKGDACMTKITVQTGEDWSIGLLVDGGNPSGFSATSRLASKIITGSPTSVELTAEARSDLLDGKPGWLLSCKGDVNLTPGLWELDVALATSNGGVAITDTIDVKVSPSPTGRGVTVSPNPSSLPTMPVISPAPTGNRLIVRWIGGFGLINDAGLPALAAVIGPTGASGSGGGGGGVTDHGGLSGLSDDDHPQYMTQGRGDARYALVAAPAAAVATHEAAGDPHPQYTTASELSTALAGKADTGHGHSIADVSGLQAALDGKQSALGFAPEDSANKGAAGGYAALDGTGKVPAGQLPGFVDDVVEFANFAALPATGEAGKLYVTLSDDRTWRWGGSAYVEISPSPGSTDSVPEGATNLYHTAARAAAAAPVQSVAGKTGAVALNKSDVGLGNVDNTSDANKPVSTAMATALAAKQDTSSALELGSAPGTAPGVAAAGTATTAARSDHVHPPPSVFSDTAAGLVPASGGGTSNFLRADGTFAAPPSGGGGVLNNLSATSAPTASNDSSQGYAVGSRWLWAARGLEWVALDVTVGVAVWAQQGAWVATGGAGAQGSGLAAWGAFSPNTSGTESNVAVSSSNPPLRRYTTAATTNAEAQLSERNGGGILSASIPTAAKRVRMIFRLPDASYGSGATGTRIALGIDTPLSIGWLSAANGNAFDRGFWLRWDTSASDTNWRLVIRTTGTPGEAVITDTGIPAEPGWYEFCCEHSGAGSSVRLMFGRLNGATFRGAASIPDGRFIPAIGLRTLSAVARAMDLATIVYQERGQW